eukprot:scaffold1885_cov161-Ochromonas_danica.AAC.14
MWMTVEFVNVQPSSNIHLGPHVPLGGVSDKVIDDIINIKTGLFLISTVVQVSMYLCIYCKIIPMPEGEDEDLISKNEVMLFFYGDKSYSQQHTAIDDGLDYPEDLSLNPPNPSYGLTLAYIENLYIVFWVSKDLFWSWGTGDLINGFDLAIFYESAAMTFGALSLFMHLITAYVYRRNKLLLLDSITTILWISANFVWMCGEFFLRYVNLSYDDEDQGNDSKTRIASTVLFCLGIMIQVYILASFATYRQWGLPSWKPRTPHVEMAPLPRRNQFFVAYSPQHQGSDKMTGEDDEETTVLF